MTFWCACFHWPWHQVVESSARFALFKMRCRRCGAEWIEGTGYSPV